MRWPIRAHLSAEYEMLIPAIHTAKDKPPEIIPIAYPVMAEEADEEGSELHFAAASVSGVLMVVRHVVPLTVHFAL